MRANLIAALILAVLIASLAWLVLDRDPTPVLIRYEHLLVDPVKVVTTVLERFGLPTDRIADTPPTFDVLRERRPDFFTRGRSGRWTEDFTEELHTDTRVF